MTRKYLYNDSVSLHQLSILQYGYCTVCGEHLMKGCKVIAGKLKDGSYAIACENCKDRVDTSIQDFVFYNQETAQPSLGTKLWRYQDFAKFISLLDSKKLFFTRADSFEDPFECARGFNFQKGYIYAKEENYLRLKVTTQLKNAGNINPTDAEIEAALAAEKENYLKQQEEKRKNYFVSCWHENERESEGMWKLYTSALSQGVAVQTTAERLCLALENDAFRIGKVEYTSYDKPLADSQVPVWYKRDSFAHEREVRVVIKDVGSSDRGILVPIDLETLIENVYVSPTAAPWLAALVKSVMHQYRIDKPVLYSQLNDKPVY